MNKHQKKYLNLICSAASQLEGKCLSGIYINAHSKLYFECKNKHLWLATPNSISNGNWCPECSGKKKHTISDAVVLAESKNGSCLSRVYINNKSNLIWKCESGHVWEAKFKDVNNGTWCATCSGCSKNTIDICNNIAKSRKGICLSKLYTNAHAKILWQCDKKHEWVSTFNNIRNGRWCPKCKAKSQMKLADILKKILGHDFIFNYRPDWLKRESGYNLEIDIFFPELKLGVEYNGEQHYRPVRFGNYDDKKAKDDFEKLVNRDMEKYDKIKRNGNKIKDFIIFTYKDSITIECVLDKLQLGGLK